MNIYWANGKVHSSSLKTIEIDAERRKRVWAFVNKLDFETYNFWRARRQIFVIESQSNWVVSLDSSDEWSSCRVVSNEELADSVFSPPWREETKPWFCICSFGPFKLRSHSWYLPNSSWKLNSQFQGVTSYSSCGVRYPLSYIPLLLIKGASVKYFLDSVWVCLLNKAGSHESPLNYFGDYR